MFEKIFVLTPHIKKKLKSSYQKGRTYFSLRKGCMCWKILQQETRHQKILGINIAKSCSGKLRLQCRLENKEHVKMLIKAFHY